MTKRRILDIEIDYELLGDSGAPAVVLTPGGRFARDSAGLPELAAELAQGGKQVLLWDRPNCGASEISFTGENESELHARVLLQLVRELGLGPIAVGGGSAGSRVSLLAAAQAPELVSHLLLWWISGGALSLVSLAYYYCVDHAITARQGGMEAVAALPLWQEQLAKNPRNRDILLGQDPEVFIRRMEQWCLFYLPSADTPVPGMAREDFARLSMPVKIFRNGVSDLSHTRATTDWVHELIPHSQMTEPPWPDDEWNRRSADMARQGTGLFAGWVALAPEILAFS